MSKITLINIDSHKAVVVVPHKESLVRINDLKFNIECLEKNSNDWFAKQYGIEDSDVLVGQMYRFNEKSPCLAELIWG